MPFTAGLKARFARPDTQCLIPTDSSKVNHILLNVLTNAATFTACGRVVIDLSVDDSSAMIAVRDSGAGMSPETHLRIFEPFTQADQRRSRSVEGAGLGLTIARQLARLLNGDLTVESESGVGSTFLLRLPFDSSRVRFDADAAHPNAARPASSLCMAIAGPCLQLEDRALIRHRIDRTRPGKPFAPPAAPPRCPGAIAG